LVMCANTAERKFLLLTLAVGFERCHCKNYIIRVILFHFNIFFVSPLIPNAERSLLSRLHLLSTGKN
jgi:hypothetical protein